MNELIRIKETKFGKNQIASVDARELHAFLLVGRKFSGWIAGKIEQYEFKEDFDYLKMRSQTGPNLKRLEVEYCLSLDMAKELCMVERNEKGRQARRYFIEIEKKWQDRPEWIAAREQGKLVRKITTDIIKIFIEYAKAQGSQSAELYYMNFSKMVNGALLEVDGEKPKNFRDLFNVVQLHTVSVAENVISKSLVECIGRGLPYKEIYQIAKQKIAVYASAVGKTKLGQSERQSVGLLA
jgi:anti-repressor protein